MHWQDKLTCASVYLKVFMERKKLHCSWCRGTSCCAELLGSGRCSGHNEKNKTSGMSGWLSSWVFVFGSGGDSGVLRSSPASGSLCLPLPMSLPVSVCLSWINKYLKKKSALPLGEKMKFPPNNSLTRFFFHVIENKLIIYLSPLELVGFAFY